MITDVQLQLQEPFPLKDISWLPGATTKDKNKCLALAYADLRAYQNRLDDTFGMDWTVSYTPWGNRIICHIAIDGITRSSTGEPDKQSESSEIAGTAAEAQAFKRACAMFGLGRYLYELPQEWVEFDGRSITKDGKKRLDDMYSRVIAQAKKTPAKASSPTQPSNHTAQHRNTPQRPATQPTQPPPPPVPEDVDYYDSERPAEDGVYVMTGWDELTKLADANRAADKKASAPIAWPTNPESLETVAGFINNPELSDNAYKMNKAIWNADRTEGKGKMSNEVKDGKKSSQYGTLVWQLDNRYGKESHSAVLSALCGRLINHDNLPGVEVKKVLDWLFNKDNAFDAQLGVLDAYVEELKKDIAQPA